MTDKHFQYLIDKNEILKKYDEEILKLIDNQDKMTRSDLQGVVWALVNNIIIDTEKAGKE